MIPDREQCLELMKTTHMLENIKRHSLVVARVASYIGRLTNLYIRPINLKLIEAAALLHDIAKTQCLKTGKRHELEGSKFLMEHGYFEVAPLVENHVHISERDLQENIDEDKLVNYADKRVLHDSIVSLETRFEDLRQRYGNTEEKKLLISVMEERMKLLEQKIFCNLPINQDDILKLNSK